MSKSKRKKQKVRQEDLIGNAIAEAEAQQKAGADASGMHPKLVALIKLAEAASGRNAKHRQFKPVRALVQDILGKPKMGEEPVELSDELRAALNDLAFTSYDDGEFRQRVYDLTKILNPKKSADPRSQTGAQAQTEAQDQSQADAPAETTESTESTGGASE